MVLGTTGFSSLKEMDAAVGVAIDAGVRGFDTSRFYHTGGRSTEKCLGKVLHGKLRSGAIKREELFVTTKIAIPQMIRGGIARDVEASARDLRLDYIDCVLLHWPFPGYYISAYKALEAVQARGIVKTLGMSNCRERHFEALYQSKLSQLPAVHQMERHPLCSEEDVVRYCLDRGMVVQAYSPLGKMMGDLAGNAQLSAIAANYNKTVAQVIIRWHLDTGVVPVFRSKTPSRIRENLDVFDFNLSGGDIEAIDRMNRDHKLCTESIRCPGY
jgi:Aldo/keto reductases, related to diketogulonate reductase